jgi:hypothetical protein
MPLVSLMLIRDTAEGPGYLIPDKNPGNFGPGTASI